MHISNDIYYLVQMFIGECQQVQFEVDIFLVENLGTVTKPSPEKIEDKKQYNLSKRQEEWLSIRFPPPPPRIVLYLNKIAPTILHNICHGRVSSYLVFFLIPYPIEYSLNYMRCVDSKGDFYCKKIRRKTTCHTKMIMS